MNSNLKWTFEPIGQLREESGRDAFLSSFFCKYLRIFPASARALFVSPHCVKENSSRFGFRFFAAAAAGGLEACSCDGGYIDGGGGGGGCLTVVDAGG